MKFTNFKSISFIRILSVILMLAFAMPMFAQNDGSRVLKRKVAIGRFSNETQYGKGIFYDKENDPMRKQALDILSARLAASGKFILLEREDLDIIVKEGGEGMNKLGADYIILGSITEFGRKTEGEQHLFSNTKTQTVEAAVSIRLVEVSSGLIIYSEEAKGYAETSAKQTLGLGGQAGYDASLSDKAISAAISQLVENIINKCTDKPWRSYILSIDDGTYVIGGGASQGLQAGDTFNVYRKGKSVVNPQTGIKVELPGTKVGRVTVQMSVGDTPESEVSMCSYDGSPINASELSNYYILND